MELVVGVSGASGMSYAKRFLEVAAERCSRIHLVVSETALQIIAQELGSGGKLERQEVERMLGADKKKISIYRNDNLSAPIASGSSPWQATVIVPCSMGTLGRIASGYAETLITRAADVALKEKRPLVLVPRETPLSLIHLRNMLSLAEAGAIILPACPAFYHSPDSIQSLVDFLVQKIGSALGWELSLCARWGEAPDLLEKEHLP